ncbi:Uncharacterised protein [[Flavobacterium] thermophilum]|nr:Uncharacterised protein [[Flavobacterium] thermophilum]
MYRQYKMCNYDYDVIYSGLCKSLYYLERIGFANIEDKDAIDELIEMTKNVLNKLTTIELIDEDGDNE